MTDFQELTYADPKDAVLDVYHLYMEIVERYFEKVKCSGMTEEIISNLHSKYDRAMDILKYNMLEIPISTFSPLAIYSQKYFEKLLSADWKEVLRKDYEDFLLRKKLKEPEGEEWSNLESYCAYSTEAFYVSMSDICRGMFNTQLLQRNALERLAEVLRG